MVPGAGLVLPIVVVPDGMLWTVVLDLDGKRQAGPQKAERCSFYVGHAYSAGSVMSGVSFTISHLEFVTLSGLRLLMGEIAREESDWLRLPEKCISRIRRMP